MEKELRYIKMDFWIDIHGQKIVLKEIELLINEIKTLIESKGYSVPKEMYSPNPSFLVST